MITIIGDGPEELADLQSVINAGILNAYDIDGITLDVIYKLSSGDIILSDEYGNIIGSRSKGE